MKALLDFLFQCRHDFGWPRFDEEKNETYHVCNECGFREPYTDVKFAYRVKAA